MARWDTEATGNENPMGWRAALLVVLAVASGALIWTRGAIPQARGTSTGYFAAVSYRRLTGSVLATTPLKRNGDTVLLGWTGVGAPARDRAASANGRRPRLAP